MLNNMLPLFITTRSCSRKLRYGILGGYALAKCAFPGRRLLFWVGVIAMLLPVQALILPQYLMLDFFGVGLLNMLDKEGLQELQWRNPLEGPHRSVVRIGVMDGELGSEILERKKRCEA